MFALVGASAALFATYWDDAWHTDRGRDTFWSAPHLLLYGGVVVALGVAVGWTLRIGRTRGWRVALGPGGSCRLAVLGGSAVLISGPIDELWHRAYGRDAVLWSPPHLLAIAGSAALIIGLLLGLAPRTTPATIGGALALGAYLIPVMEFESDVPQFRPALYLPVLAIGVVLALPVVRRLVGGRWPLTTAAAVYTVARTSIAAGLAVLGHSTAIIPPLLAAAVAADLVARRRRWLVPTAVVVGLHVAYVPLLRLVPHGLRIEGTDLAGGFALSLLTAAGAAMTSSLARPPRPASIAAVLIAVAVAATLADVRPAAAHDPGQGVVRGGATFEIQVRDESIEVAVGLPPSVCGGGEVTLIARRAGRSRRVPAHVTPDCRAAATLRVDETGRWFVYVEHGRLESWVPVETGGMASITATRDLYERPPPPSRSTEAVVALPLLLMAASLLASASREAAPRPA
jgi:hypothetical protein